MSAHDTTVLPSYAIFSADRTHAAELGDLFMRMFLSRMKNWPVTLTGGRPSTPTNYAVNRISAPSIDSTETSTPASYEIYDPQALGGATWVDLTNTVFCRAIAYFGGFDTSGLPAVTAIANASAAAATAAQLTANAAMSRSGGTFTGPVTLSADAAAPLQPVTLEQLQALTAASVGALPLSGGTLTGALLLNADPTAALGSSTKQYVDNKVASVSAYNGIVNPALLNILVQSTSLTVPPVSPVVGYSWFIPASTVPPPSGLWSGQAGKLATWGGSAWTFQTLTNGSLLLDGITDTLYMALAALPSGLSVVSAFTVSTASFGAI